MPTLGSVDYIPDNVLVYSPERALMWWTPAAVRRLFISEIKGVRSGEYPVPPKLFLVLKGKLHTWALGENRRPDPSSAVFRSPFYNVYETGACCMGNIKVPDFNGTLTSHLPPKLSGIEPEDFWKKIKGKKRFPVRHLRPYATLTTIIKAISSQR
jgi:PRTRC genetic system protein B